MILGVDGNWVVQFVDGRIVNIDGKFYGVGVNVFYEGIDDNGNMVCVLVSVIVVFLMFVVSVQNYVMKKDIDVIVNVDVFVFDFMIGMIGGVGNLVIGVDVCS